MPFETVSLVCRSCGAGLHLAPGADRASCAFCGTPYVVPGREGASSPADAERLERVETAVGAQARLLALAVERGQVEVMLERSEPGCASVIVFAFGVMLLIGGLTSRHAVGGAVIGAVVLLAFLPRWSRRRRLRARLVGIDEELRRRGVG
jgi:LSD1 subclass zinc finger protein